MKQLKIVNMTAIKKELIDIEQELSKLPAYRLYRRREFFSYIADGKEIGITRQLDIIKQLCRRAYLLERKKQIHNNLKNCTDNFDDRTPQQLIAGLPQAYQNLPLEYFYHPSVEKWFKYPPRFNTIKPDEVIYEYNNVNYCTLSEREIAQILTENNLLFYYDANIDTGTAKFSPDFYIKNPFSGRYYILEFFGAFHKTGYGERMNDKMASYIKIGFHENDNLITTFNYHLRDRSLIQDLIDRIIWQI